jgi:hypothetical protein
MLFGIYVVGKGIWINIRISKESTFECMAKLISYDITIAQGKVGV